MDKINRPFERLRALNKLLPEPVEVSEAEGAKGAIGILNENLYKIIDRRIYVNQKVQIFGS